MYYCYLSNTKSIPATIKNHRPSHMTIVFSGYHTASLELHLLVLTISVTLVPIVHWCNLTYVSAIAENVTSGTRLTMMPECRCRTKRCKLTKNKRCQTELFIGIPVSMHLCLSTVQVHATKFALRVHVHAACPCQCCMSMSMSMLHAMSMLHVHLHFACSCQCCIPFQCCIICQCFMSMSMSTYIYEEMPECRTVRHPVSPVQDWKKLMMPEHLRYRTKLTQPGIFLVKYRTKIRDAGMPKPALVSSMLMPSYGICHVQ